jgi:hypothetical protein
MTKRILSAVLAVTLLASPLAARPIAKEGETCGGYVGIECAEGLWCDPEPGMCKGADISGRCVRSPAVCTGLYRPVCGCDGNTQSNNCWRQNTRVPLDHEGACKALKKRGEPR